MSELAQLRKELATAKARHLEQVEILTKQLEAVLHPATDTQGLHLAEFIILALDEMQSKHEQDLKDQAARIFANFKEEKAQAFKNYEDAFRAMEQRAKAAEAMLASLQEQHLERLPGVHFGKDER